MWLPWSICGLLIVALAAAAVDASAAAAAAVTERKRAHTHKSSGSTGTGQHTGYSGAVNACPVCDVRKCPTVTVDSCDGQIVKDECNCCPECDQEVDLEELITRPEIFTSNNSCESVTCPRNEMCIVNIQNIPMCRCPSQFWCKHGARRPLCSEAGVTYKSRCYLKIDECTTGKKIKIRHKGNCRSPQRGGGGGPKPSMSRLEKLIERAERRKERRKEKRKNKQKKHRGRHSDRQPLRPQKKLPGGGKQRKGKDERKQQQQGPRPGTYNVPGGRKHKNRFASDWEKHERRAKKRFKRRYNNEDLNSLYRQF